MQAGHSLGDHVLDIEDAELVLAYRAGDVDAFDHLFDRHYPPLVRHLSARFRDPATAEDLAQETMIRAMRAIEAFDCSRPLRPWLRRIADNAAVDLMRSDGRSRALRQALANQPNAPVQEDAVDISESDALSRALAEVPDRQRQALLRCYVEGWRPMDAAPEFGVGSNAFEQLLHRARRSLRQAYLRQERGGWAAGVAWAGALVHRLDPMAMRLRRMDVASPSFGQVVASGVIAASIAVTVGLGGVPSGAPEPAVPVGPSTVPTAQAQPVQAPAEPGVDPVRTTPRPAEGVAGPRLTPARPAPVAVQPLPDPPAPSSPRLPVLDPPTDGAGPVLDLPPVDPDMNQSAPEVLGGCGSTVRAVVCQVDAEAPLVPAPQTAVPMTPEGL